MKNRKRLFATGCLVLLLLCVPALPILWFFGMPLYGEFDEWRYQTPTEFSERKWKSNEKYRWVSVDLLIEDVLHEGMKKDDIIEALGNPDSKTAEGYWLYHAKRPGWNFIDFSGGGLVLKFKADNRLESAENTTWVD